MPWMISLSSLSAMTALQGLSERVTHAHEPMRHGILSAPEETRLNPGQDSARRR